MSSAAVLTGHIDSGNDRAVYKQIAEQLRDAIGKGRLREGKQLPSETQLMEHYGRGPYDGAERAANLAGRGLTTAEHGRGVYVRARPPVRRLASDRFAQRHRKEGKAAFIAESEQVAATPSVDMLKVSEGRPPGDVADRLGLADDEPTVIRSRRYSLDGRPVETAVSYIPADLARGTPIADPNPGPGGIYARLEEAGHTLDRFTEEVAARMPTPEEARVLALPPGVPVFRLVRTAHDRDVPAQPVQGIALGLR
jgi:GntR family transcriptional regulator